MPNMGYLVTMLHYRGLLITVLHGFITVLHGFKAVITLLFSEKTCRGIILNDALAKLLTYF